MQILKILKKYVILWAQCVYAQNKNKFKKLINFSGPGFGNGKRVLKSAQKLNYSMQRCSLYSSSLVDTMLSLQSFFQVIPHETAVARFAAAGERAEISDFCHAGLFLVWYKRRRSLPLLPRGGLLDDPWQF